MARKGNSEFRYMAFEIGIEKKSLPRIDAERARIELDLPLICTDTTDLDLDYEIEEWLMGNWFQFCVGQFGHAGTGQGFSVPVLERRDPGLSLRIVIKEC